MTQQKCKGCDGLGTYQLLGPVLVCEQCRGSGLGGVDSVQAPTSARQVSDIAGINLIYASGDFVGAGEDGVFLTPAGRYRAHYDLEQSPQTASVFRAAFLLRGMRLRAEARRSRVDGNANVYGNAIVSCDTRVDGNANVYGNAIVSCDTRVDRDGIRIRRRVGETP